jgi:hypothetical protein
VRQRSEQGRTRCRIEAGQAPDHEEHARAAFIDVWARPTGPESRSAVGVQVVSCRCISAESCRFVIWTKRPSLTL